MTQKAWNSLKWEPDFARPDKVTSQLNDITKVVQDERGSKFLQVNETAFNNADYNYVYAKEFDHMNEYKSSASSSASHDKGCDSSSSSSGGSLSVRVGFFFKGSGRGYHKAAKSSCNSLFNARSGRSTSSIRDTSSSTDVERTDVKKAGLENWKVGLRKLRHLEMSHT